MERSHRLQMPTQGPLQYRIRTFAKLNLTLSVSPKRPDGYHNIDSIFQTISLCDTLLITLTPGTKGLTITCNNRELITTNIITTIYAYFEKNIPYGIHIDLDKQIPIGAGLGGGSSNAAGFLWALSQVIPELQSSESRQQISQKWGADIPFFIQGGTAQVTGVGEIITPIDLQEWSHYVMVYPNLHISSRDAYDWFDTDILTNPTDSIALNHLKKPVMDRHVVLRELEACMTASGVRDVRMSGSGSTLFAPLRSQSEAERVSQTLSKQFPTYCIHIVTNTPYGVEAVSLL